MSGYSFVNKFGFYCALSAIVLLNWTDATISDDKNTLTFKWYDDIVPEQVNISEVQKDHHPKKHLALYSNLYQKINSTLLLEATNFTYHFPNSTAWINSDGFVNTVFYSYQKHHNLIVRPDDIWTAILIQFSLYINANAEELRHSFVNFEGKQELKVTFVDPVDRVLIDDFVKQILNLINENIDPAISNWILPNFTTTTENDRLTAGVALMATVHNYFEYRLFTILCGIPQVTILGNVDDWKEIRKRVEKLKEFELNGKKTMGKWSFMLGRILDQFISVKEGNKKDDEFWKQAIRTDNKFVHQGCGRSLETFLNGWITAFSAFDKKGRWQKIYDPDMDDSSSTGKPVQTPWLNIPTDQITPGIVQVPIQISDAYAGQGEKDYTGSIITGHMGYSVNKDKVTIQPLSGWAMTITNNPPEYLKYKINSR